MVYVSNSASNSVTRFNSITGEFIDEFVASSSGGLSRANDMEFGPEGNLYVVSEGTNSVLRYDGTTGDFVDTYAAEGDGGLGENVPFVTFGDDGFLYVANDRSNNVLRFVDASAAMFSVSLSSPSDAPVTVDFATADDTANTSSDYVAASGTITFAPGQTSRKIFVQMLDDATYEGNESFLINLSNAVGGVISDGQGVGRFTTTTCRPPSSTSSTTPRRIARTSTATTGTASRELRPEQRQHCAPRSGQHRRRRQDLGRRCQPQCLRLQP